MGGTLAVRAAPLPFIAALESAFVAPWQRAPLQKPLRRALETLESAGLIPHRKVLEIENVAAHGGTTQSGTTHRTIETHRAWPAPDWGAVRRGLIWALGWYIALAILLTWPTVTQMATRRAGDNGDGWVFVWNYWFFARALETGAPLLRTSLLFHPFEVPLVFNTMQWFNCALAWPLSRWMGPIAVYNTLFLGSLVASALSAFVLYASLSRRVAAAVLCGAVFGFSPYFLAHGMGHPNLISAQFLPLFALCWLQVLRTGRARWGVMAGLMLACNAWCDWHWLLFALVLGAVLLACVPMLQRQNRVWWRARLRAMAAMGVVAGVLLAPLLGAAVREVSRSSYANRSGESSGFRLDLVEYFQTAALNPNSLARTDAREKSGEVAVNVESEVSPGWALWILAGCGLWGLSRNRRRARVLRAWRWVALTGILFAAGTQLTWRGGVPGGGLAVLTLAGAPGNGFDWPWQSRSRLEACRTLAFGNHLSFEAPVFLPSSWLQGKVPFLKPFRVISRFCVLLLLAVGLAATFGLARLQDRVQVLARPRGRPLALGATGGVWIMAALLLIRDYAAWPYPNVSAALDPLYAQLKRDPAQTAIVEVPLSINSRAMWGQTVHGKPLLVANIARCPPEAFTLVNSNAVLLALREQNSAALQTLSFATRRAALQELRTLHIRTFLVHQGPQRAEWERALERIGLKLYGRSAQISVFRL